MEIKNSRRRLGRPNDAMTTSAPPLRTARENGTDMRLFSSHSMPDTLAVVSDRRALPQAPPDVPAGSAREQRDDEPASSHATGPVGQARTKRMHDVHNVQAAVRERSMVQCNVRWPVCGEASALLATHDSGGAAGAVKRHTSTCPVRGAVCMHNVGSTQVCGGRLSRRLILVSQLGSVGGASWPRRWPGRTMSL